MAVTSLGEMHDHKCQWKDDKTLDCGSLAYTAVDGSSATEELTFTWTDAKTASYKAVISAGPAKISFEGSGKRK